MDIVNESFVNLVMCRACMLYINRAVSKPLFAYRFSEMFTKCTDIKVDYRDGLPPHLCLRCFRTLNMVHSFKEQCLASDLKLKELLKTNPSFGKDTAVHSTAYVDVQGIQCYEDYLRNSSIANSFLELPKHELVNTVDSNSKPIQDAETQQIDNLHTNTDADVSKDIKSQQQSAQNEDIKSQQQSAQNEDIKSQQQSAQNEDEGSDDCAKVENVSNKEEKIEYPVCAICNTRSYATLGHLKRHLVTHNQAKNFKCDICDKHFKHESYVRTHKKTHTKVFPFACDLCEKRFERQSRLEAHMRTHNPNMSHPCQDCNKILKTKSALKAHRMRKHMLEKNLVCDLCGKMFFEQGELKIHIRIHTKEKPYECSYCKKRCTTKSHLISHIRMHTGSRPYACDLCPKTFGYSRVRKEHRMTHTGERPHVCHLCQRAFTQLGALRTHMKVHTGTPPSNKTADNTTTS